MDPHRFWGGLFWAGVDLEGFRRKGSVVDLPQKRWWWWWGPPPKTVVVENGTVVPRGKWGVSIFWTSGEAGKMDTGASIGDLGQGGRMGQASILLSVEASEFLVDEDIAGAVEPALDVGDEAVAAVFGLAEEMRGKVDEGEPAAGDDGSGVGRDAAGFSFLIEVEALAEFLTFGHVGCGQSWASPLSM